jgi:hypothetical protein
VCERKTRPGRPPVSATGPDEDDTVRDLLAPIGDSAFFESLRGSSSLLAYPTILFLHTMGMALVVGLSAAVDLRLLGFAPRVPLAPIARIFPWMWAGFVINALSGSVLLFLDLSKLNLVFYTKILFIALALTNLWLLRTRVFADPRVDEKPLTGEIRLLAFTSIVFWVGAITGGRLMAYLAPPPGF